MAALQLHEDRYFSSDPGVRSIARDLYNSVRDLPLVCPHGHVDPRLLAENVPFSEPTSLILTPDHYLLRMLFSQGVPLESLGISRLDGRPVEADPRRVWQIFADNYHLFRGTPSRAWLDFEFYTVFGIRERLDGDTGQHIYDQILEQLKDPGFRPRALFERFGIELLTTTDGAADSLEFHKVIREEWAGQVVPCFRPDAVFKIAAPAWESELDRLGRATGIEIGSYSAFVKALEDRRQFFRSMGATSTDHGTGSAFTQRLSGQEVERLFQNALSGRATHADQAQFEAHMLMEMARMSVDDGMVMQIHPGVYRNHDQAVFDTLGPDMGGDIPLQAEYTRNLHAILNAYGTEPGFTLVVFTLDEATYGRELAPLAGHYPALRIGPPWWFFDSVEGMRRYRENVTETAGFYNTAGFNDDTRAFLSIPARHDLARRVDSNYVAGLVARHQLDLAEAHDIMHALAYDLVRKTYKVGQDITTQSFPRGDGSGR